MTDFLSFLNSKNLIILDGAMGTELQRHGYKTKLPLWSATANLDAQELVKNIHLDYINAGADLIVTNTFRTQPHAFAKVNKSKEEAIKATKTAVKMAKEAKQESKKEIFIGGGLAPLEDCYEPNKVPENDILEREHFFQAELLANENVDFLICETFNCIRETEIAAKACQKTSKPFFISFVTDKNGDLLSKESLENAIKTIKKYNPSGFLLNCRPFNDLGKAVNKLLKIYDGIKGVYANGIGMPDDDMGWKFEKNSNLQKFIQTNKNWYKKGIKIIGGCCGTTPQYIEALKEL